MHNKVSSGNAIYIQIQGIRNTLSVQFKKRRRHIHTGSDDANVKIWLKSEVSGAFVKGHITNQ